jgi:hypothetical protein
MIPIIGSKDDLRGNVEKAKVEIAEILHKYNLHLSIAQVIKLVPKQSRVETDVVTD